MNAFRDQTLDIQNELERGELSISQIAVKYAVSIADVEDVLEEMADSEQEYYDESMDGDFDSAMASAGFGTDEDYGYYGDEY